MQQRLVAGAVAAQVVDLLEAVEVDADHRDVPAVLGGVPDLAVEMIGEAGAVGQAGQRVVQRHVLQLLEALRARMLVDEVARDAGADHEQRHRDDRDRHGLEDRRDRSRLTTDNSG